MAKDEAVEQAVHAARTAVLVVGDEEHSVLRITGEDRTTWLNGLVTCDLAGAKVGDAAYGLAVSAKGRVIADMTIVFRERDALVVVPRSAATELRASLEHYLVMEDAEIDREIEGFSIFVAHGPRSAEILEAARAAGGYGGLVDATGLGGAIVLADHSNGTFLAAIAEVTARVAGVIGSPAAWDALRIERQVVKFGREFDMKTYPQEAGLEARAISFSKGCYLGQEVVCMLELRGHVKRKIVGLKVSSDALPSIGAQVFDESGASVGAVTSACFSPTNGAILALAMVKRAASTAGTHLKIDGSPAEVVEAN